MQIAVVGNDAQVGERESVGIDEKFTGQGWVGWYVIGHSGRAQQNVMKS